MTFDDSKPKLAIVRDSAVAEINRLHQSFSDGLRATLQIAIQIGELLVEQKRTCGHGNWIPWIKTNLNFDRTTAFRYTRCYYKRSVLNVASTQHLTIEEFAKISDTPSEEEIKEMNSTIEEAKTAWLKNPTLSVRALAKQENLGHGTVQKARTALIAAGEFPLESKKPTVPIVKNGEIPQNEHSPLARAKVALKKDPTLSNRVLAKLANTSDVTVGKARRELVAAGEIPHVPPPPPPPNPSRDTTGRFQESHKTKTETETKNILSEKLKSLWGRYGYGHIGVETIDALLEEIPAITALSGIKTARETWEVVRKELKLRGPEHNIRLRLPI